ncbi:MAG: PDZ domain-containing protein [Balneolaceae bacterium]
MMNKQSKWFAFLFAFAFYAIEEGHVCAQSQAEFYIQSESEQKVTIPFELINNLIVIEASINGSVPLKFVLDTGVGTTLITGLPNNEDVYLKHSREITLAGLGENEPRKAYLSEKNSMQLKGVRGENIDIAVLFEDIFNLSSFMGTYIHGLTGYDLFANFVVEINYIKQRIYLYEPGAFKRKFERLPMHRKWHKFPIVLEKQKPYIYLNFKHSKIDSLRQVKLLIDSGASNAFSFYKSSDDSFKIPNSNIKSLIGIGLSGVVNGKIGRVHQVALGNFKFKEPIVAFPDSASVAKALQLSDRNGSVGGEILRRFKVIFHYKDGYLLVRRNSNFKKDFNYNMSGVEVVTPLPNLPFYIVSKVRQDSPAHKAGVMEADIIKKINGTKVEILSLNEVLKILGRKQGLKIKMEVQRDSTIKKFNFQLQNELAVD